MPGQKLKKDHTSVQTALLVGLAVVLLLEVPAGNDPHFPWKYTAFLLGAGVAACLAVPSLWRQRGRSRVSLPLVLLAALVSAMLIRGLLAAAPFESALVGTIYRYDGILTYSAGAVFLLLSWRFLEPWRLLRVFVGTAGAVALWALFTAPAGDPLLAGSFANSERDALESTLGNANFLAAFLAMGTGACLAVALRAADRWRWIGAGTLVLLLGLLPFTRSLQALPIAAASLLLVIVVWGEERPRAQRRTVRAAAVSVVVLGLLATFSVATGIGPGAGVRATEIGTIQARAYYWQVAVDIVQDDPLGGVGPAGYRGAFSSQRSVAAAVDRPFDYVDSPHNAFLRLAAEYGLIVSTLYLALVLSVGWRLLHGLVRLRGPQRLVLAGVGAVWVGFQLQSLVSIEVVPLTAIHFIASGVILGAAASGSRPGPRPTSLPALRASVRFEETLAASLVVLLLGATPLLLRPLRAELATASGIQALATGSGAAAQGKFAEALQLVSYEPEYAFLAGRAYEQQGDSQTALKYYRQAAAAEPGNARFQLGAVRASAATGDVDLTLQQADLLLRIDPYNPQLLAEVARLRLQAGQSDTALAAARRLTELEPDEADAWVLRGRAALAADQLVDAREAYETALQLEPGDPDAEEGLQRLIGAGSGAGR